MLKFFPLCIFLAILNCHHHGVSAEESEACEIDDQIPSGMVWKKEAGSEKGVLGVIGDVNDVLNGIVRPNVRNKSWVAADMGIAGIGAAAFDRWESVGEAVFLNGLAIIRSAENGTADYYKTKTGPKFRTQFTTFITKDAKRDGEYTVKEPAGITMNDFYKALSKETGKPFCFVGLAQFGPLKAIALTKAAIYGEKLFGETKKRYYANPMEILPDVLSIMVGCVADYGKLKDGSDVKKSMSRILYVNPLDTAPSNLEVHSHAVTLNKCKKDLDDVKAEDIKSAYHMVSDTVIKIAKVCVFVVKGPESIVDLNPDK